MSASHDELPEGINYWCPITGKGFHCAYCHREECETCRKNEVEDFDLPPPPYRKRDFGIIKTPEQFHKFYKKHDQGMREFAVWLKKNLGWRINPRYKDMREFEELWAGGEDFEDGELIDQTGKSRGPFKLSSRSQENEWWIVLRAYQAYCRLADKIKRSRNLPFFYVWWLVGKDNFDYMLTPSREKGREPEKRDRFGNLLIWFHRFKKGKGSVLPAEKFYYEFFNLENFPEGLS